MSVPELRKLLLPILFEKFKADFYVGLGQIKRSFKGEGEGMPTHVYSELYSIVYLLCNSQSPDSQAYGQALHDFFCDVMRTQALPNTPSEKPMRDYIIRCSRNIFNYLDRFFVPRMEYQSLTVQAHSIMDKYIVPNRLALKRAFRRWSLDEELLAGAFCPGGVVEKRGIVWLREEGFVAKRLCVACE